MVGVEAAGHGIETGQHAATLSAGQVGVLHGDEDLPAAGRARSGARGALDLGRPRLSGRRTGAQLPEGQSAASSTSTVTDDEALDALERLARTEGIIPALETAHAIAHAIRLAPTLSREQIDRRQPLGARRQGHGDRRAGARRRRCAATPRPATGQGDEHRGSDTARRSRTRPRRARRAGTARAALRGAARARRGGLHPVHHGRRSRPRHHARSCSTPLVEAGADVIELGVPFSDPMADGPVHQRAAERALRAGTTLRGVLELVAELPHALGRADRPVRLRQSVRALRRGASRRGRGRGGRRRAAVRRPAARGGRRAAPAAARGRPRHDLPARADQHAGAHRGACCARRAASSTSSRCPA